MEGGNNPLRFQVGDLDVNTPYATPIDITLTALNGTPPYNFVVNTNPANGTLQIIDASTMRYTPKAGFLGDDTFTVLGTDANAFTDIGIVRVNVGTSSLTAENQAVNVPFGSTNFGITLVASGGNPPYTLIEIVSAPTTGFLTPTANPLVYTYTPPADFLGTTSFVWSVTDSAPAYDQGTVTINVVPGAANNSRIVFASDEGSPGNYDIYVINADGSAKQNLTNSPSSQRSPALVVAGWDADRVHDQP